MAKLGETFNRIADLLAVALACLATYTAGFGVFDNVWYSGLTVGLGMTILFLRNDPQAKDKTIGGRSLVPHHRLYTVLLG